MPAAWAYLMCNLKLFEHIRKIHQHVHRNQLLHRFSIVTMPVTLPRKRRINTPVELSARVKGAVTSGSGRVHLVSVSVKLALRTSSADARTAIAAAIAAATAEDVTKSTSASGSDATAMLGAAQKIAESADSALMFAATVLDSKRALHE